MSFTRTQMFRFKCLQNFCLMLYKKLVCPYFSVLAPGNLGDKNIFTQVAANFENLLNCIFQIKFTLKEIL